MGDLHNIEVPGSIEQIKGQNGLELQKSRENMEISAVSWLGISDISDVGS